MKFDNTELNKLIHGKFGSVEALARIMGIRLKKLKKKLDSRAEFTAFEINMMVGLLNIHPKDISRCFFTVIEPQ
jgi:hypothetical protein